MRVVERLTGIAIALALLAAIAALGWPWLRLSAWLTGSEAPAWFQAFGSAAAIFVVLWQQWSLRNDRERQQKVADYRSAEYILDILPYASIKMRYALRASATFDEAKRYLNDWLSVHDFEHDTSSLALANLGNISNIPLKRFSDITIRDFQKCVSSLDKVFRLGASGDQATRTRLRQILAVELDIFRYRINRLMLLRVELGAELGFINREILEQNRKQVPTREHTDLAVLDQWHPYP